MGHPLDQTMRTCRVAVRLGRRLPLDDARVVDVFYAALLQHVGCTAAAHELSVAFGDDIAAHRAGARTDFSRSADILLTYVPEVSRGRPLIARARLLGVMVRQGQRIGDQAQRADCEVASATARRIGLPESVQHAVYQMFEWWNGKGAPRRLQGEELAVATRVTQVASLAVLFDGMGGPDLAAMVVGKRAGRTLDPEIAELFLRHSEELLGESASDDLLVELLASEPEPHRLIEERHLDAVALAFGDVVDLKSPFLLDHARRVGELAEAAARSAGLAEPGPSILRRAGFLHDLGRAAVSSSIWAKPGPLSALEWEQVRLHAYHSERILSRSPTLEPVAEIVALHHERQDGSGYHRRLHGHAISPEARILAAADVFVALTQERPHRERLHDDDAAVELRREARAGRLDPDCVAAVLTAAGRREPRRRPWPAGLTARQVEVLRLVAEGLSNRQIAQRLTISPRTAEHHVQDVYTRIGVSSRAAVAVYALEHGLLAR